MNTNKILLFIVNLTLITNVSATEFNFLKEDYGTFLNNTLKTAPPVSHNVSVSSSNITTKIDTGKVNASIMDYSTVGISLVSKKNANKEKSNFIIEHDPSSKSFKELTKSDKTGVPIIENLVNNSIDNSKKNKNFSASDSKLPYATRKWQEDSISDKTSYPTREWKDENPLSSLKFNMKLLNIDERLKKHEIQQKKEASLKQKTLQFKDEEPPTPKFFNSKMQSVKENTQTSNLADKKQIDVEELPIPKFFNSKIQHFTEEVQFPSSSCKQIARFSSITLGIPELTKRQVADINSYLENHGQQKCDWSFFTGMLAYLNLNMKNSVDIELFSKNVGKVYYDKALNLGVFNKTLFSTWDGFELFYKYQNQYQVQNWIFDVLQNKGISVFLGRYIQKHRDKDVNKHRDIHWKYCIASRESIKIDAQRSSLDAANKKYYIPDLTQEQIEYLKTYVTEKGHYRCDRNYSTGRLVYKNPAVVGTGTELLFNQQRGIEIFEKSSNMENCHYSLSLGVYNKKLFEIWDGFRMYYECYNHPCSYSIIYDVCLKLINAGCYVFLGQYMGSDNAIHLNYCFSIRGDNKIKVAHSSNIQQSSLGQFGQKSIMTIKGASDEK